MRLQNLIERYKADVATIENNYSNWVYSVARNVDISKKSEMKFLYDLTQIMNEFRTRYKFVGVSSNNIYWNATEEPLRVIQVPDPRRKKYITLVNPEIKELTGDNFESIDGCGSIPGIFFRVARKQYTSITGYTIKWYGVRQIGLEYGAKHQRHAAQNELERIHSRDASRIVQHECDHLDGILLLHRGIPIEQLSMKKT